MSKHAPPVPPANRTNKGPGGAKQAKSASAPAKQVPENLDEQGRQGDIKQNTTNQGHQQDR